MKKKNDLKSDPQYRFVEKRLGVEKTFRKLTKPIESKPSQVIDIGEKYQIVTGMDEDKAGGLDPRLMPNLHKRWMPSDLNEGRPYNAQLYKNAAEQEFYEGFIQPLFKAYKTGRYKVGLSIRDNIQTHHWEKLVSLNALGPEKALFENKRGRKRVYIGEVETTLILIVHLMDDIVRYKISKVALRFGASIYWVKKIRKKIKEIYGKLIPEKIEDHIEKQLERCEAMLDTFITKAKDGDPYAAKIVKEFMDKEDQYIMPTLEQLPAKDTEEKRNEAIERLEKIFERKKIEEKTISDIERLETTPEMIQKAFKYQKEKDKNEKM